MLTCIACTKQLGAGSLREQEEDMSKTPRTKHAIKALTAQVYIYIYIYYTIILSVFFYFRYLNDLGIETRQLCFQIKDMAVKASGAYKHCKPCSGSSNNNQNRNYADSETGSASERFHCSYRRTGSANSTPRVWGKEMEARLKGLSSGEGTPASVSGRTESVVFMDDDEPKEWVAQVEPGVLITFVSLPQGGNDLKRIRFR